MQTYGVFVSSNTEVANDKLKADSVNTITNGSVKKYEIISAVTLPDGSKAVTLRVIVSTKALSGIFENQNGEAKINGTLFALKFKQQLLNEKNEAQAVKNMVSVLNKILDKAFNYTVEVGAPSQPDREKPEIEIPLIIRSRFNANIINFSIYFLETLDALSIPMAELKEYNEQKRDYITLNILPSEVNLLVLSRYAEGKDARANRKNSFPRNQDDIGKIEDFPKQQSFNLRNSSSAKMIAD